MSLFKMYCAETKFDTFSIIQSYLPNKITFSLDNWPGRNFDLKDSRIVYLNFPNFSDNIPIFIHLFKNRKYWGTQDF